MTRDLFTVQPEQFEQLRNEIKDLPGPITKRPGMEYVGALPESDKPWVCTTTLSGTVVFSNPDHPAMTIENGELVVLKPDPMVEDGRYDHDRCCCECGTHFDGTLEDDYCPSCFDKLPEEVFHER